MTSIISSRRTNICFTTQDNKTQCIEVTFRGLDDIARLALHRRVCVLYSIRKAKSIGKCNNKIHCPYFAKCSFVLGFRNSANNPVKLLEACSGCMGVYDNILAIHLLHISEKMILIRKRFGVDVGNIIIRYGWGI